MSLKRIRRRFRAADFTAPDADGYLVGLALRHDMAETRAATRRYFGRAECVECAEEVALVADAMGWDEMGVVEDYGPPTGSCCGRLYAGTFDGEVEVYRLPAGVP